MRIALYAAVGLLLLLVAHLAHADLSAMFLSIRQPQNTSRFDITRNTGTNFSFSADHLTATELNAAPVNSNFSAFTTLLRSDVRRFFRFTVGTASSSCGQGVGLATATEVNTAYLGHGGGNSIGIFTDGSTSINNTSIGNTGITFGQGDVIDLIVDPASKTVQEIKNGGAPSAALSIASLSTQNVSPAISLCAINDSMTYNGHPPISNSGAVAWDAPASTPMISGVTASPGNFITPSTNPVETLTANCSAGQCTGATFSLPSGATTGCTAPQVAQNGLFTISGNNLNASSTINGTPTENVGVVVTKAGVTNSGTCWPLTLTGSPGGPPPPAAFVANFSDVHQVMDGFGASNAWVGNLNPPTLDALYCINATDPGCSGPGIGLTLLRLGIDTTDNGVSQFIDTIPLSQCVPVTSTCVPSQVSAAGAKARGATLFATSWIISVNNQTSAAQGLANWASGQASAGIPLYAMTTGNEVDCCSSFPFPPGDTANFVKILGPLLHAMSIKLISPEVEDPANFNSYVSAIEADSAANAQVDIFSTHQYGCGITCMTIDGTRHVWQDEASDFTSGPDNSLSNALNLSQHWIYDAVVTVGISAWNYWNTVCGTGNPCDAGLVGNVAASGSVALPKRYFGVGNWSKFVRPGWVRIGTSGPGYSNIYVAAFKSPDNTKFAIVALNYGSDAPGITFGIQNATITGNVTPYVTSGTPIDVIGTDGNLSAGSASSGVPSSLVPNAGVFTSTVPGGITTFVGTAR